MISNDDDHERKSGSSDAMFYTLYFGGFVTLVLLALRIDVLEALRAAIKFSASNCCWFAVALFVLSAVWTGLGDAMKRCEHRRMKLRGCQRCKQAESRERASRAEEQAKARAERAAIEERQRAVKQLQRREAARVRTLVLRSVEQLRDLSANEFEDRVAQLFRDLGWDVTQTAYVADGGFDAAASKSGRRVLIECKRYSAKNSVGRPDLQKFWSAMQDEGAELGYVVTTGRFSRQARDYAADHDIDLVGPKKLAELLRRAYPGDLSKETARAMCVACGVTHEFGVYSLCDSRVCECGATVSSGLEDVVPPIESEG